MIDRLRLSTPREPLAVLVEPAPADLHAALAAQPPAPDLRIAGRPLHELRAALRARLNLRGPVVASGHQVEFFHPGVLAKLVAADALAQATRGTPVFLAADSDVPKSRTLAVPQLTAAGLRRVDVRIPAADPQLPVESHAPAPRAAWLDFFARAAELMPGYRESALPAFTEAWLASDDDLLPLAPAMARGRQAVLAALDVRPPVELRESALAATPEFRLLAAEILTRAEPFADSYNRAWAAYRRRNHERNAARPVPRLHQDPDRTEVPFWLHQPSGPRRHAFVARAADRIVLLAERQPVADFSAAELNAWAEGENTALPGGWQLRPRALTLSAFMRLLLADLFIHGIGGAKYDEMTDDFAAEFFTPAALRPIACVTATLYLPLPAEPAAERSLAAAERAVRDIRYNPQRYLPAASPALLDERTALIRRSDALRAAEHRDRRARRDVYLAIRRVNQALLAGDPWRPAELDRRRARWHELVQQNAIARDREYFFGLHPQAALVELSRRIRAALGRG